MKKSANLFNDELWENTKDYPDGTKQKVLRDDANNGKTVLLKLPAGFHMAPHSHITTEQHFVLDGQYTSDGVAYSKGAYKIHFSHEEHGPFESENGALILVVWDPFKKN